MDNDIIGNSLNLTPIDEVRVEKFEQVDDDFEFARNNLKEIISKGNQALEGILDVADQSQHPRSYEVVATMINSLTTANKDLLELQKRKKELKGEQSPKTINNNLFIGSTAELQKLLKNNNEE